MHNKRKNFFKSFIVSLVCLIIYVGSGYLYLNSKVEPVKNVTPSVPYYSEEPENVGLLVDIEGDKTYLFLDFYYNKINVIFDAESYVKDNNIMGHPIDHSVTADYGLLAGIIDRLGGIELESEEGVLRYTGVQVVDLLLKSKDYQKLERSVTRKIFEKIGENGFSKEDFLYIIENSNTTLTFPVCYYWVDYISELFGSVNEVN